MTHVGQRMTESANRCRAPVSTLVALSFASVSAGQVAPPRCLHYEPAVVEVRGRLVLEPHYGPPNYGEDTATDEKVRVPMLLLSEAISVCGDTAADSVNAQSFARVGKLQFVVPQLGVDFSLFMGQNIVVTGTMYEGINAHYYTDVAIGVQSVRLSSGRVVEFQRPSRPVHPPIAAAPAQPPVFITAMVDQVPELLSAPQLVYPEVLRTARIQGRVVLRFVVDTLGGVEPGSVQVVTTPNPGFNEPAIGYVLAARFRPGYVRGRPVRVLLELPIDFRIDQR